MKFKENCEKDSNWIFTVSIDLKSEKFSLLIEDIFAACEALKIDPEKLIE